MKFALYGGQGGEGEHCEVGRVILYCSLEADEGSVDLAYAGQRQHDLSPVLRILLQRVSFKVDRLQRLGVLQLVEI